MMLLDLQCAECILEHIKAGTSNSYVFVPFEPVNDSGIYVVNCVKGHKSYSYIDNVQFEILFDYGINALADGYYREAVNSFTSALERYFEFFVKTSLNISGHNFDEIDNLWKLMSVQSERQLGAYLVSFANLFKTQPLLLNPNKEIKFRNKVVHKGYIPSFQETLKYGDKVLEIIEDSLIKLKTEYAKQTKGTFEHYSYKTKASESLKEREKQGEKIENVTCVNILTTLSVINGRELYPTDTRNGNVESQIERVLQHRKPRVFSVKKGDEK